ncbi:hypothetical protein FQR65_LT06442 [Abscondita terminalis]|nr:hypothetical protein FQR65_LT06442 [Abscondita terminalis]
MKHLLVSVATIFFIRFVTINGYEVNNWLSNRATKPNDVCPGNNGGFVCDGCRTVQFCVRENGVWQFEYVATCGTGQVCDNGACVVSTVCPFPTYAKFNCLMDGIYPDPADCKKYHVCQGANENCHKEVNCASEGDGTYGYNPLTTLCSVKLTGGVCTTSNVPTCSRVFERGPIPQNPSLYYECRNYTTTTGGITDFMYPYQRRCLNGLKYSATTQKCSA